MLTGEVNSSFNFLVIYFFPFNELRILLMWVFWYLKPKFEGIQKKSFVVASIFLNWQIKCKAENKSLFYYIPIEKSILFLAFFSMLYCKLFFSSFLISLLGCCKYKSHFLVLSVNSYFNLRLPLSLSLSLSPSLISFYKDIFFSQCTSLSHYT